MKEYVNYLQRFAALPSSMFEKTHRKRWRCFAPNFLFVFELGSVGSLALGPGQHQESSAHPWDPISDETRCETFKEEAIVCSWNSLIVRSLRNRYEEGIGVVGGLKSTQLETLSGASRGADSIQK